MCGVLRSKETAMKRLFTLLTIWAASAFAQTAETVYFRAIMLPSNENPPIDIAARGMATIRAHIVRDASGKVVSGSVDFSISYQFPGEAMFTGLHIHKAPAGVNGSVLIPTDLSGTNPVSTTTGVGQIDK